MTSRRLSLDQLADYRQLRAGHDALWTRLAAARTALSAADVLANALDAFYTATRARELDPAQVVSVALAADRLGAALAAYRDARKAGSDG